MAFRNGKSGRQRGRHKGRQEAKHQSRHSGHRKGWQSYDFKAKKKTSFLSDLKKIALPSVLLGAFAALAYHMGYLPQDIWDEIRAKNQANQSVVQNDAGDAPSARLSGPPDIVCRSPKVTDGDTLRCGDTRIRLEGIDSPEMGGKCRPGRTCVEGDPDAAKANLQRLVSRGVMECSRSDTDHYGRMVARCVVAKVDLSCEQLRTGHAIERYSRIRC